MNLTESFKEDSGMMLYFVKKSPGDPSKEMEDAYSVSFVLFCFVNSKFIIFLQTIDCHRDHGS